MTNTTQAADPRDALTRTLTAFPTYSALLTACRVDGYRPGLWPIPRQRAISEQRSELAQVLREDGVEAITR